MSGVRLTRRNVLRAAGGLAVGLPLFSSLRAHANDVSPRRLLIYFHPNGVLPSEWFPTAGSSETDFTFSKSLAPLEPLKQHLLITSGIDLKCTVPGPGEPHQKGMGALMTGWHLNEGTFVGGDGSLAGWAKGQSIDHRIAQQIGAQTKLGSFLLGIRSKGGDVKHHLSYAGDGMPLPTISDPKVAWDALFKDFNVPNDPATEALRRRRGSVLDAVREQLVATRNQLAASERQQLDQHLTLVRDLELRLAATTNGAACSKMGQPPIMEPDSAATMPDIAQWQIDLMAMAFACDLTRVGTLQFSQAHNYIPFPWINSSMDGHSLSHLGASDPNRQELGWRDRWYAEQFAYLLNRLASIPEGDGTVLDHTLIWWMNELGEGNTHSHKNMPFILAGHGAGFRMGRYVQYDSASHSALLLSILHAFGVDVPQWGNPDFHAGELSGLY